MKLKKGRKAPAFTISDQDGNMVSLSDYAGHKVALFFYPQDNTPTCTKEACNLRDNIALLKKKGIAVIGVSTDTPRKHQNFIKKFSLPFPLLADVDKKLVNLYGVWDWKTTFGVTYEGTLRTTFLINEEGKIDHIIEKVDSGNHAQQIVDTWEL
ncbi:MAG: thioredoxin-dependent thiol peroxidase [Flavipsychrobacter sp.]|nr:thioredoxin-dependent thiol peroxidase [Flavipsychrobacter sp.]